MRTGHDSDDHDPLCPRHDCEACASSSSWCDCPCDCALIARARADEAAKWSAAAEQGLIAQRARIAQAISEIFIPDLSAYGPTGAADWMRYEASRVAAAGNE